MEEQEKQPDINNQNNTHAHPKTPDVNQPPELNDNYDSPGTLASYSSRDEETAAELSAQDVNKTNTTEEDSGFDMQTNSVIGWAAVALSVISFFWLPILFGAAGIITGFMARNRHATTLGNIAIAAGAIAIIVSLFVTPFMAR